MVVLLKQSGGAGGDDPRRPRPPRRAGWAPRALILLAMTASVACGTPGAVVPAPGLGSDLEDRLHNPVVDSPGASPTIVGAIITLPADPAEFPVVSTSRIASDRPASLIAPQPTEAEIKDSLTKAGYYLAVQDRAGAFVSLIELGDPRVLRGETFAPGTRGSAALVSGQPTVLAVRFPFPRRGSASLYESNGAGGVSEYRLRIEFGWFAPRRGWRDLTVTQ